MKTVGTTPPARGEVRCERQADDTLVGHLVGHWTTRAGAPVVTEGYKQLTPSPPGRRAPFEGAGLAGWERPLLAFLGQGPEANTKPTLVIDQQGLPDGVR